MRYSVFVVVAFCLFHTGLSAQTDLNPVSSPVISDFAPTLRFLSSDWMEGREAGTKGGFMAADYMASMMQFFRLEPYGDLAKTNEKDNNLKSYFQDFDVLRYKTGQANLAIIQRTGPSHSAFQLTQGIDFDLNSGVNGMETEAPLIFAGYGISAADKSYDDYKGVDVSGKIVVVLSGFPGHADTTSAAWKKLSKSLSGKAGSIGIKQQAAKNHKAVALIVIAADGSIQPYGNSQINLDIARHAMSPTATDELYYDDPDYCLPGDTSGASIPCFRLGSAAARQLLSGTGIDPAGYEKKAAGLSNLSAMPLKDKIISISFKVKAESLRVRNVVGIIHGKDSTRSIMIGAHYDHLGMRNGLIYNGSDDNASGACGLLALAKNWAASGIRPPYNIIFASWTAEEKGLLGSRYYAQHMDQQAGNIMLYLNMDMISRSAPGDTAKRIISIGTRAADEQLREIARKGNSSLDRPLVLDLWDVTGHTGSDYASFTAGNIPVMTFFSGYNDDYHTPRDISSGADLKKMADILQLVNNSLRVFLENTKGKQ